MSPLINIHFVKKELHNKGVIKFNNELKLQQAVNIRPSPRPIQKQTGIYYYIRNVRGYRFNPSGL
jgi:hypothetical protein